MGFLDRIFGKGDKGTLPLPTNSRGGGSMSVAAALMQQKGTVTPESCDECGATYMSSEQEVLVLSQGTPNMTLDIGGYCQKCRKTRCQKHVEFGHVNSPRLSGKPELKDAAYGVVCARCGTQVRHDRHRDPERTLVLVSMDGLLESAPAPKKEYASAGGRLSLHKVVTQQMGAIPQRTCARCSARYPHPPQPMQINITTMEVSPDRFDVDIGGHCASCGDICSKHAVFKETRISGQRALRLFCERHDVLLT